MWKVEVAAAALVWKELLVHLPRPYRDTSHVKYFEYLDNQVQRVKVTEGFQEMKFNVEFKLHQEHL